MDEGLAGIGSKWDLLAADGAVMLPAKKKDMSKIVLMVRNNRYKILIFHKKLNISMVRNNITL